MVHHGGLYHIHLLQTSQHQDAAYWKGACVGRVRGAGDVYGARSGEEYARGYDGEVSRRCGEDGVYLGRLQD